MNSELWFEKYRPERLEDLLIKKENRDKAIEWISSFKGNVKGTSNCLFLHGPPGVGKTTFARILLNSYDYDIRELNASELRNAKVLRELVKDINGNINVLNFMCNKKKKIGIIMDEIDGMSGGDKGGLTELIELIFPKIKGVRKKNLNGSPFICISNTMDKKIKLISSNSVSIKFQLPTKMMLINLCKKISAYEKIEIDALIINKIVQHSQGDFRRLINILQYFYNNKLENEELTYENIDTKLDLFDKKQRDFTSYEIIDKFLNLYPNISDTLALYHSDRNVLGLLMIENSLQFINKNRKGTDKDKLKFLSEIYTGFSDSDIYDHEIYINQKWELHSYNGTMKVVMPSYIINKELMKYSCNKFNDINYSTILNKGSLEYQNFKNINTLCMNVLSYSNSNNYIGVCDILVSYLIKIKINGDTSNLTKFIALLKHYNLTLEDLTKKILRNTTIDYKPYYTIPVKKLLEEQFYY